MNLYQFKIHYYVDYEDKEFDECGLIIAEDYIDAIKKIDETFGWFIYWWNIYKRKRNKSFCGCYPR